MMVTIAIIFLAIVVILLINYNREPEQAEYEYGWCKDQHARKNIKTNRVQFLLWKPGEHGHEKGCWCDMGFGHDKDYFKWDK